MLYVPIQGSVYGFQIDDGERVYNWEDLHKQLVTAIVQPAGSNHIITGSHDMTAKVMHANTYQSAQSHTICHSDLSDMFIHTASATQIFQGAQSYIACSVDLLSTGQQHNPGPCAVVLLSTPTMPRQ